MERERRKRVRHIEKAGQFRELTFSTYQRRALLREPWRCQAALRCVREASERHGWRVIAFVVMPEHVHLLVYPDARTHDEVNVSAFLAGMKRTSSYRIKQRLLEEGSPEVDELTIRERPGKAAFRFWQEGGGFDRNIVSEEVVRHSIRYIHRNPVRRGLCGSEGDWPWSSWAQWHRVDDEVPEWMPVVKKGWIGRG